MQLREAVLELRDTGSKFWVKRNEASERLEELFQQNLLLHHLNRRQRLLQLLSIVVETANTHVAYLEQFKYLVVDVFVYQTFNARLTIAARAWFKPRM